MADFELVMPKMGESIIEATILGWLKQEGDVVDLDETILEIATDKVDSEIPSPVKGKLKKILFHKDDVVAVGETIALIETNVAEGAEDNGTITGTEPDTSDRTIPLEEEVEPVWSGRQSAQAGQPIPPVSGDRFYSPLVRNIALEEGITLEELDQIAGSGINNRVTKQDILSYLGDKKSTLQSETAPEARAVADLPQEQQTPVATSIQSVDGDVEIIEMDRMRKMIAQHMIDSKRTSAHVTSFVEADVTNIVKWRKTHKQQFEEQHQTKLTYTPFFILAVAKALRDFPKVNASVDGDRLLVHKRLHIGMATAMPNGNLIVPVIKDADDFNLAGLSRKVNDLAERARKQQLSPEEIQGGTFTLTNVGTFGNVMGTPIINQPQVAILATGAIRKKPAVVETEYGDLIAIRHMVFLSMSYDHRVIDGFLGGSFLRRVADYLEEFDDEDHI